MANELDDVKSFDPAEELIAELKEPETDNAGPESATKSPKMKPITPEVLRRLEGIAEAAAKFRNKFDSDPCRKDCGLRTYWSYDLLRKYLDGKPSDMTRQEIEDAAAAARDLAAERSEQLDEQEHEAANKIEDLEAEVADLRTRYRAAVAKAGLTPLIEQLERDHSAKLADMEQQIADILLENERLHTELDALANKIEDLEAERDELVTCRRLADARAYELATAREHWKRQAHELHCKLDAATELVSKGEDEREELELAIGRLTCERDELKRAVENNLEALGMVKASRDEWKGRAEAAEKKEKDGAAFVQKRQFQPDDVERWCRQAAPKGSEWIDLRDANMASGRADKRERGCLHDAAERDELKIALGRLTCERDELKRVVEDHLETMTDLIAERDELRKQITETIERTQAAITYCGITVEMLGGVDKRNIERETHGTDSG